MKLRTFIVPALAAALCASPAGADDGALPDDPFRGLLRKLEKPAAPHANTQDGASSRRRAPAVAAPVVVPAAPAAPPSVEAATPAKRPLPQPDADILDRLANAHLTADEAARQWSYYADEDNADRLTLPLLKALVVASDSPKAREAMWSELSGLAKAYAKSGRSIARNRSLLGLFERHRAVLRPLLAELKETEGSRDEMIELMTASRVFGADLEESVAFVSDRIPAAIARHIEREREMGRPVKWEYTAFESMIRWKEARLTPKATQAPRTLDELDAAGEQFVIMFNCLHSLDEGFREVILRGLGPAEIFNAVVGGEQELYRLGTSGYRRFLHAVIMQGIKDKGSFEAFIEQAVPRKYGPEAAGAAARRGMVFVRVVSSFGLLDGVLETVRDRERFIEQAIVSLGDPRTFEGNASVVMDVLMTRTGSSAVKAFRKSLLDKLYARFGAETEPAMRSVYGSMLSVYQSLSGDRRNTSIGTEFALDDSGFKLPFGRLFKPDARGTLVHRMFMRMDEDVDAVSSYAGFRVLMYALGASVRPEAHYDVYRIYGRKRTIEIYANRPTSAGVKDGIAGIAAALKETGADTVIGRGHTSIIARLQTDARRVLGARTREVTAVLVGACGGDASVRELIATFGYVPYFTTKSTGRQVINNAIIEAYVRALLELAPEDTLSMPGLLERAAGRFKRQGSDEELRADAGLYQVNMATVLTARLFDAHVKRHTHAERHVAGE